MSIGCFDTLRITIFNFKLIGYSSLSFVSITIKCIFEVFFSFNNIKIKPCYVSEKFIKKRIFFTIKNIIFVQTKECSVILTNTFFDTISILSHTNQISTFFQKR